MKLRSRALVAAGLAAIVFLAPHAAGASSIRTEYAISLYGFVLARSSFQSTIDRDSFDVRGSISSAGVASLFDDTHGTTSVRGNFGGLKPLPNSYAVDYVSGDKKKNTRIAFSGGSVVDATNMPPVNTNRAGWIPVTSGHLAGVADPISATLVPAEKPADVCGRTISVFDGALRADLRLAHAGYGQASIPGYRGETVTCTAKFVPIAGYRQGNSSIEYLKNSSRIAIAFAPIGSTGVYAPVEASVSTKIGTVKVRAVRFEASN